MNQKGALLPTALVFLILLTLLLLGTLKIYQNQFEQLQVTKDHYQAKTMISLTKKKVKRRKSWKLDKGEICISVWRSRDRKTRCLSICCTNYIEK